MARRMRRSEEWWTNHPEVLRCTAHYKSNKQQCQVEAAPGTNVCNQHGALIPAVQAKAATRIGMSVDDAVKRLQSMLDDSAVDARDKIKILHDLLDRGGLGATSKVLVGVGQVDAVEKLFSSLLSDPAMLASPQLEQPPLDPELAAFNRATLDKDDFISSEVVARTESPARSASASANPPPSPVTALESGSSAPPKHIRDDLEALGLI